jgi:hypothetical protein
MAIKLQTDPRKVPTDVYQHLLVRMKQRQFLPPMAKELAEWFAQNPDVPDLNEAPKGWHREFSSFTILCEGPYWKSLYTIYHQGTPRQGSVDWDVWNKARKLFRLISVWLNQPSVSFA